MNDIFNRISDRDLKTTLAYLVLMICLSCISFIFLFEIDGVKMKAFSGQYFAEIWTVISFWLGILCILSMLLVTFSFAKKLFIGVSPDDKDILNNAIERLGLPAVISTKNNLKVILRSNKAVEFYDEEIMNKTFSELDSLIINDLHNGSEWINEHKKRINVAENLVLDSTSEKTMKFKTKRMNSLEWRLTSCPIMIKGKKHYFTLFSPAKEDDIAQEQA